MTSAGRDAIKRQDLEARDLACAEFEKPVVMEAGAGTGKTATLIARVVTWCTGPGWDEVVEAEPALPRERVAMRVLDGVVAITFTEAAAAEMATRVGEALVALQSGGKRPHGLERLADTPELRERAAALLGELDHLTARTIHGWCLRLLAAHPIEAGLPLRFSIDADETRIAEAVRESVRAALLEAGPDDPIVELVRAGVEPREIRHALLQLASDGVPPEALEDDLLAPERFAEARDRLVAAIERLEAAGEGRATTLSGRARSGTAAMACAERTRQGLCALSASECSAERVASLVAALVECRGTFTRWSKPKLGTTEREHFGAHAAAICEAAGVLAEELRALERVRPEILEPARRALPALLRDVRERMLAARLVRFADLLHGARDLLRDHPGVARRVRESVRQLLVDEMQDTDVVQCEIVASVAGLDAGASFEDDANAGERRAGAPRPGLFLVGDPKQSIYGWRNADLRAYERFRDRVLAAGGLLLRLSVSFRSVPAVLDEVERALRPVMVRDPGVQPELEPLVPSDENVGAAGFTRGGRAPVEYWDCRERDPETGEVVSSKAGPSREVQAHALADELRRRHDEDAVAWSKMAVLLRSTGELDALLEVLREHGIPYTVGKERSYYRRREIVDLGCLVRGVLDPHDQPALVALLRSVFVGVPDAAWIPLWARGLPHVAARLGGVSARARREDAVAVPAGVPGLAEISGWPALLESALSSLAELRRSFHEEAPDVFLGRLRRLFAVDVTCSARYLGAWRVDNVDRFLRELEDELAVHGRDAPSVLRSLRSRLAEPPDEVDDRPTEVLEEAVPVLTIHGAKGLDFEHVYLVHLERTSPPARAAAVAERARGRWELSLFKAATPGFVNVERRRRALEAAERVRLLYVAMTRAKQRLVLAAGWPDRAPERLEAASSHADLLAFRDGGLGIEDRGPAEDGEGVRLRHARGACWVVPDPEWAEAGAVVEAEAVVLPPPAAVEALGARLRERREEARVRAARAFSSAVTETPSPSEELEGRAELAVGLEEPAEPDAALGPVESPPLARRSDPRRAGTAVHRALELLELDAEDEREAWERACQAARSRLDGASSTARAELDAMLERVGSGRLLQRLRGIGESGVLARELPVLLPPDGSADAPVGFVSGAIDLVYRDADGRVVVADFKTDRVSTRDELRDKAAEHAPQLRTYVRALKDALALAESPRAELWMLWADEVVTVGGE